MDISAFLSSKAAESAEQGSKQTTKTPTLKRGGDDSVLYSRVLFVEFNGRTNCILNMSMYNVFYVAYFITL